jgi:RNA polymerase sigma-70 factor (TIGR02943 family)
MNVLQSNASELNPENWVDLHGNFLYQYALLRLGNDSQIAEDMVQDTFLSALKSSSNFQGKSSQRTWFVSILRNKIIDFYRKNKDKIFEPTDFQNEEFIESGSQKGQWKEEFAPADWSKVPDKAFEQNEFNSIFDICLNDLPQNISSVFTLRELEGWETEKICKDMSITSSNLWVMLHRARTQLRRCLEMNWLDSDK